MALSSYSTCSLRYFELCNRNIHTPHSLQPSLKPLFPFPITKNLYALFQCVKHSLDSHNLRVLNPSISQQPNLFLPLTDQGANFPESILQSCSTFPDFFALDFKALPRQFSSFS